ncbi:hypothetical protein Lfu02_17550 [Longispora fulva]|uniref:Phage FDXHR zinc binding domain-containing protein n=1 Tax=Longispora fulva TaxID=619741 RepID=A0A8J7GGH7_9ACTN|nr:hypothetical protein [Longispora fulva]MBG6140238.1 hypothetical protein [Longispora fulva]GIG57383.1 hypothetical protein Lfu02_17550 [Longispora fulva]
MRLALDNKTAPDGRPLGSACGPSCLPLRGQVMAHCSVCHNTFGGVTHFDAHRSGGYCHDPASKGLVREAGLWATEEGHDKRRDSAALMEKARASRGKNAQISKPVGDVLALF